MSAGTDAPDTRLTLPEGYATKETDCGRLAIYDSYAGLWIGEVDPLLSGVQELADNLVIAYEVTKRNPAFSD